MKNTVVKLFAASLLLCLCEGLRAKAAAPQEKDYAGYLFVYFKSNQVDGEAICYAVSRDGYAYRALNGNRPVIDSKLISTTGGVRDPHILRAEDGSTFYMVCTDMTASKGWDSNRAMVLMKSNDLVNWTSSVVNIQKKYPGQESLRRVWAPQTIYDAAAGRYLIYWSMKHGDAPDIIYYAYANRDFTDLEGEPKQLFFPKNGKACIDGDIVAKNGLYYMFYKTEGHGNGIKLAITDSLASGRWIEQPGYKQDTREAVEGAFVFKLTGSDKYLMMYDVYKKRQYQFCESVDLDKFSAIDEAISMDFHPRHGSIIPVTASELRRITDRWGKPEYGSFSVKTDIPLDSIRLSDPFIFADDASKTYFMTGTGGLVWKSKDLRKWTGPYNVVETDPESWMGSRPMIWAAEIHKYNGKYYYFATFTNRNVKIDTVKGNAIERRACHILVSSKPDGMYVPMQAPTYLPADAPTLDATFWVEDAKPYMLYCHEWLQNWNGTVEAIPLKPDLSGADGKRKILFFASDSPWSKEKTPGGNVTPNKVTDGPYVFRTQTGRLGIIWTSWVYQTYTQGVAYSDNGKLSGSWIQEKEPITPPDFGHGMLFRSFEGKLLMAIHSHKADSMGRYIRTPHLFEVDDSGDKIVVGKSYE
jgi:GH43 family beta-xylosidase